MNLAMVRGFTDWDYAVIAFYFTFMVSIGLVFRHYSKNISDYFRGGGSMLWWMSGASAMMGALSAWSFTGAAGEYYKTGLLLYLGVFLPGNIIGGLIGIFYTSYRFRQMRVITSVHAIRRRYGPVNEQFYVWCQVPINLFYGGLVLNTLSVFLGAAFGTNLLATVITTGVIVLFVASAGGAWGVIAGDFVQMLVMQSVVLTTAFLTLHLPQIGGLGGLLHQLPASAFHWTMLVRPQVLYLWLGSMIIGGIVGSFDLSNGAARFMTVKDGRNAVKAAIMMLVIGSVGGIFIMIPPLAARVLYPHLHQVVPNLHHPSEAAYLVVAMRVLPDGMLGLLVTGLFAVTMANMDTGLNRNAGIFIKNFYSPILRPRATERELMLASRVCSIIFGLLIIGIGILIALFRTANLFNYVIVLGVLLGTPLTVPLAWGMLIKRTPPWAAWSTVLAGFFVAAMFRFAIPVTWFPYLMGWHRPLSPTASQDVMFVSMTLAVLIIASGWYLFTMRFADRSPVPYKKDVEMFFKDMNTPIDPMAEGVPGEDYRQCRVISRLCLVYGSAMLLAMLIPNTLGGRLCFMAIGIAILTISLLLHLAGRKARRTNVVAAPDSEVSIHS